MTTELNQEVQFTVDAALLRELGERLVGKPHIALAELVKNGYDADATEVEIVFEPDVIQVVDNGHGMSEKEFKDFWMRVGSPHKERQAVSRGAGRPLTGSKGVGRLAVQFLGDRLRLETVAEATPGVELAAEVDWRKAVTAGDLTKARARYGLGSTGLTFPADKPHGTRISISSLKHGWNAEEFRRLAEEIWSLRPPFKTSIRGAMNSDKFNIRLRSPRSEVVEEFERQIRAIEDIWYARLRGRLQNPSMGGGEARVSLQLDFADGEKHRTTYSVPDCHLHETTFEIRIFHLTHRQPKAIKVGEARSYFNRYGGVHVYDAGFRLPYYGVETDWLRIEMDHSHRLERSRLLPESFRTPGGLSFLPTNSRILGQVHVNTARERQLAGEDDQNVLQIQVTRDRLADNGAYRDLVDAVRWALDYYAVHEAQRSFRTLERRGPTAPPEERAKTIDGVLRTHAQIIPAPASSAIRREVRGLLDETRHERERLSRHAGVLGALATAGMSALAYEHEVNKQFHFLSRLAGRLERETDLSRTEMKKTATLLRDWLERAKATRRLFAPLLDEENREKVARFQARRLLEDILTQTEPFLKGVETRSSGVSKNWRLPPARYVEWSALFQNVFVNAANAMLHSNERRLSLFSQESRERRAILVQDTGVGVDLATSNELFEPFERRVEIDPQRRALGLGGMGLGLTIVRMIAENIHCRVGFIKPSEGYSTAVEVSWEEGKR